MVQFLEGKIHRPVSGQSCFWCWMAKFVARGHQSMNLYCGDKSEELQPGSAALPIER